MHFSLYILVLAALSETVITNPFPQSPPDSEISPLDETALANSGNVVSPSDGINSEPHQMPPDSVVSDDSTSEDSNSDDQATSPDTHQIISDSETQANPNLDNQDIFSVNTDVSDSGFQVNPITDSQLVSTIDPGAQIASNTIDQSFCEDNTQPGSVFERDTPAACFVRHGSDPESGSGTVPNVAGPPWDRKNEQNRPKPGQGPQRVPNPPSNPQPNPSKKPKDCTAQPRYKEHLCCEGGVSTTPGFSEGAPVFRKVDFCMPS